MSLDLFDIIQWSDTTIDLL